MAYGLFQLNCDFDISNVPFDTQLCVMHMESIGYVAEMQMLHADGLLMENLVVNEQWDVSSGFVKDSNLSFASGRTYSVIEFGFHMRRKASFYGVSMILPLMASSLIELTTFALAIDDVNRLQLSFTCFLSFTFFISMLTEKLPQNSENLPFLLVSVSVTAGTVSGVIVLQAIAFFLATSKMERISLAMEKRLFVAKTIDRVTITIYSLAILVIQIIIPGYFYFRE